MNKRTPKYQPKSYLEERAVAAYQGLQKALSLLVTPPLNAVMYEQQHQQGIISPVVNAMDRLEALYPFLKEHFGWKK